MASSSASTSTFASPSTDFYYPYDVFINCHGSVKNTFARHLYRRLESYRWRVFLDSPKLQEGDILSLQIEGAVRTASVHVAIFSPRYPESVWCLNDLLQMLESRAPIIPVFYHVTPAQVRFNRGDDGVYAQALRKLEEKRKLESNTIESWRNALSAVAEISGFDLEAFDGDEGELLDRVVDGVLRKLKKPALIVAKYPTGLAKKVNDFENKVLLQPGGKPTVAGIVGLGGVGKTTLAKELFNRTRYQYNRSCFVFDVRENARIFGLTSLQKKLLKGLTGSDVQIDNIYEGKETLKKHLSVSNAFIVLDDVDHQDQVEALLPDKAILCSDNFILITSRDKDVLTSSGVENGSIYRLTGLNEQHSRELFCSYAFPQPYPSPGFESMVDDFLEACDGLPFSLRVFGGRLYGADLHYWEAELKRLENILPDEIQARLLISYNSLNVEEKHIFLDIACFFIGEDMDKAIRIWDGCGWEGRLSFRNLQNKSLVEADSENYIRMHDHLRDLGRYLAEQEPRSRLWRPIDSLSDDVSQQSSVRGIYMVQRRSEQSIEDPVELGNRFINFTLSNRLVDMTNRFISSIFCNCFVDMGDRSNNFTLDNSFLEMSGLQLLRAEGNCLESISHGLRHSDLVWLHWNICPYTSLPDWIPKKNLRVLEVNGGELETLWQTESEAPLQLRELNISSTLLRVPKSIGHLRHLEKMDLSWCRDLQTLPTSLGNLANLRYINLNGCLRLEDLPDSFGNLSRLQYLYLAGCSSLTISSITFGNIRKLEILDLSNCRRMEALPPQVTDQHSLKELNVKHTNLTELPIAIGNLRQLEILKLQCPFLEMLPSSLGKLTSLEELTLHFCNKLRHLPDSVGELTHLTTLTIHYAPIEYLPAAVMRLNNLEILKIRGCPLLEVPFNSVEKVGLQDSSIDKTCMIRLRHIDLQGTRLKELSFCEGVCPNLQRLNVSYCHELVLVGALPTTLISLDLQECPALKEIKGLSGLAQLRLLDISGCDKIEELPGLDTLGSLEELRADGCNKVECIGKIRMNMRRKSRDSSHSVSGKKIKL